MSGRLKVYNQEEYTRVLNEHNGHKLSNAQCIDILVEHGASYNQAKNGAYTYLHHGGHLEVGKRGSQDLYNRHLDKFDAVAKSNMECIHYLENLGFSQGQSKSAVYNYRRSKGLIK